MEAERVLDGSLDGCWFGEIGSFDGEEFAFVGMGGRKFTLWLVSADERSNCRLAIVAMGRLWEHASHVPPTAILSSHSNSGIIESAE